MSPLSNAFEVAYVRGRIGLASLNLAIGSQESGGWKEQPFLHPESRIMISNQETRDKIEEQRSDLSCVCGTSSPNLDLVIVRQ